MPSTVRPRRCTIASTAVLALLTVLLLPAAFARADAVLGVSPGSWDFGNAELGTDGSAQAFTVTNQGDVAATLSASAVTGGDPTSFEIVSDDCADVSLDPGSTCPVTVRFRPTGSQGGKGATLEVAAPAVPTATANLSGKADLRDITFSPGKPFGFADTTVGSSTKTGFQISNNAQLPVTIGGFSLTGTDADQFSVGSNDCPTPLYPGQSCSVSVDFRPTRTGPASASLEVSHDGATQPLVQSLSGEGVPVQLSINPGSVDFGLVEVNRDQPSYGFWIQNTGRAPVDLGSSFIDGPGAGAFQIEGSNCNGTLQQGQGCNLQVRFRPSDRVAYAAVLHLPAGGTDTQASLAGAGGVRQITPDTDPLDFGPVDVGRGVDRTMTLTSTGNLPFQSIVVIPNGGDVGSFRVMTDDCSMVVIDPSKTCALTIRFLPQAPGPVEAAITVIQGDGQPAIIHVRGTGLQAAASLSPGGIDFGAQAPGTAGAPRTVTVTNRGTASLRVSGISVGGADAGAFAVAGETCTGAPVAPGGACTVRVRFAPDGTGTRSATLGVLTNDAAGAQSVTLTGEGSSAVGPLDTRSATVAFDWLPGLPSPFRDGRVDLGRLRCIGTTACSVRVQARLSTGGTSPRRATVAATWHPGAGSHVSMAIPRSLRRAPVLLVATLRTTAAGRTAVTRTVRIPLVAGRRLGSLVATPPPARQSGSTLRLGALWCVRGPGACTASAELSGATAAPQGTSTSLEVRPLSTVAIRLSPSGTSRLAVRRPANLAGDEVTVLLRAAGGALRSRITLGGR